VELASTATTRTSASMPHGGPVRNRRGLSGNTKRTEDSTMGKVTGFMEFERVEEGYKPVDERVKHYKEFVIGLDTTQAEGAGRALHGLRHAVLQQRLPGQQHHSGLQRPGVPQDWKNAFTVLDSTNNFPSSPAASAPRPARPPAC
jgi:hypothetical protein